MALKATSRRQLLGGLVGLTLTLSACTTAGSASSGNASGSEAPVPADVQANLATNRAEPTFKAPGSPIDVTSLRGKTIFVIPQTNNPFIQSINDGMKTVADKVGVHMILYPNQGQVSQWVQGMNAAITAKVDAIVLTAAPDPRALQPQIAAAKAAGIPVIVTHFYDESSATPPECIGCSAGVAGIVAAPFNRAGKAAADWIIADSGQKAHVYVLGSKDVIPSDGVISLIQSEMKQYCTDCKVTVKNIPVANWNTQVQGEVQAALTSDPTINYVYPLFDAMVGGAVTAIRTVGKAQQTKVVSYNGSPYALKFIQDKNVVAMDVGEDTIGIGHADMDQVFRVLLGQKPVAQSTPIRIWDATNIDKTGKPPVVGKGYGQATVNGFLSLWGLQK